MDGSPADTPEESAPVVLVVDDDPDILLLCELYLRAAGFTVLGATSGTEALARARAQRPAVIVLAFRLGDMEGTNVFQALQAEEATRAIPVVMLTGLPDGRDQQAALELGVFDSVSKPFDKERFLEAVSAALIPARREEAERRRSAALQRQRAMAIAEWHRLAAIVESSQDAIIGKTLDGTITSWNPAAERLYGYAADEVIGRPIGLLAPVDRRDEIPGLLRRLGRGERIEQFETVRQHRDGHLIDVSLSISPIRDESGAVTGASTIARDLTGHRQAQERFRTLVETAPDAIVIVDESGVIDLVNRQAETLFGYDRADLVGQLVEMLVPEWFRVEHPRRRTAYLADPLARPMAAGRDLYGLRKDGTEFPAEVSLSPLRTAEGITVSAIIRDVTERKRTEAMFRGLLESAPDSMVLADAAGRIRLVNVQTERLFGYAREELLGQAVEMLVPQQFRTNHVERRTAYMVKPRVRSMGGGLDLYGLRKDGSEFPVEISLSPLETSEGIVVFAAVRDVTDRKQAEHAHAVVLEREREAGRRLRELDRLRGDFLATVSHELRTPLAVIKGFAEILHTDWAGVPETQKVDLLGRIARASTRLDALMSDLLDFTRLEHDQLTLNAGRQPLARLVKMVLKRSAPLLAAHPIDVAVDEGLVVMADPAAFSRVLEHLLSNAAKFSPAGSTITLSAHPEDGGVAIGVADSGPGIPPGETDKIFERFYRVGGAGSHLPGTGIGLAIVKELTEAQGGRVEVTSTEGGGSTFTLHFPGADPSWA